MYAINGIFYIRFKDASGKWRSISTGTRDEAEAREVERSFSPALKRTVKPITLEHLLTLFMDPSTNPSFVDSEITGHKYGKRHAQEVARNMRDLLALLKEQNLYWNRPLKKLTRFECKQIMVLVHGKWGNTHKAHDVFAQFKVCMTYAAEEDWIKESPCVKMADIKAERVTEIIPMTIDDIRTIIHRPELFRFTTEPCNKANAKWRVGVPEMDYAVFVLMATTGMRRGEVGAMTCDQVQTGINGGKPFHYINIDKAYKTEDWKSEDSVGLPKWDFCRSIAISDLTYSVLEPYLSNSKGRVFKGLNQSRFKTMFQRLRENAILKGIEWEDPEAVEMLSPHKLRHALNTNLLCWPSESGEYLDSMLVSEYLSWEHQETPGKSLPRVQREHYTHINARRLIPVARCVDGWWNKDCSSNSLVDKEKNILCI